MMSRPTSHSERKSPILVTGINRSGSTWVGHMLALSKEIGYIHEPFNRNSGISGELMQNWYTYICRENEHLYRDRLADYFAFKYPLLDKLNHSNTIRDIGRSFRDWAYFTKHRLKGSRPLVKDPIAVMSASWLAREFDMDVVLIIRHPAAYVGSIKKAGWRSGMKNFLRQPLLLADHLEPFKEKIDYHATHETDIIDEAILIWNMIHSVILKYREEHGDEWQIIKHEDLSRAPSENYEQLYRQLSLEYTDHIRQKINRYSTSGSQDQLIQRDSRKNIWSWKKRLTPYEIDRIRQGTDRVSSQFYTDEEW